MGVHTDASQLMPLLASGYQLLPLHRFSAEDEVKGKKRKRGKSPIDSNWMKRPYQSEDQIKHMDAGNNVGVRLRPFELVLDVDPRAFPDGQTLASPINPFVELVLWTGMDPDLYSTVETGSGGLHIYMTKPKDVSTRDSLNDQFPGIEFKTVGRQVVAPGSIHPDSQKTYTWKADTPELDAFGAEAAPKALVDLIRRPSGSVATGGGEHDQEELAQMLVHLDPADFSDHDNWLTLMQACHHATAGDGRQEFVDWCTQDPAYADDGNLIGLRWDSLHADAKGPRVTYRTLHKLLRDAGVEDAIPRTPAAEDFEDDLEDLSTNAITVPKRRPVHEGGLAVNKNTGVAPDTAKNALKAINGSKLDPRFDELKQRVVLMGELPWGEDYGRVLTDKLLLLARTWLMEQHQRKDYQPSKENVQDAITTVAYFFKFNPILDYLDSLTWDGTSRVKDLFTDAFQCRRDDYTEAVSQCFMVGAVARQRQSGCKLDTMPVIKGPQGSLKSTGIRDLFSPDWFSDAELGDLRNKDAAMNLEGVWVHEFAELAGLRASDMDVLKAFMSRATDRYRTPYGRNTEDHQRRVVFAGTVNEGGYLSDPTGARRFWPLEMAPGSRVDLDWIDEHRDQLWAEADSLFKSGVGHVLPEQLWSMAAERQADETVDDPWVDKLADMLSNRKAERQAFENGTGDYAEEMIEGGQVASPLREPPLADKVHTQDLLSYLGLESDRQNKGHAQRLRRAMEVLGWKYSRGVRLGGRVSAGYHSPDE
ncbi:VapE domain-containing protein [uncultured Tateyamaria sp.]|uniref:VapE domain-containing protein n=1 Tax=uncultured Tateyamaria sp. TaxID=455651 RepID=UPI002618D505|nr:VapE domain-containing protein [uncultured Tateyamaria sp.]